MSHRVGQEAGASPAGSLVARLAPWAVVPVPLLLAAIVGLWALDVSTSYGAPGLLPVLNFTLVTCTSAVIALLAARTFVATGIPGVLFLGAGVLLMGVAFAAAPMVGMGAPNVTATVHNIGMLAAGALSLIGAWMSFRPRVPVRAPGPVTMTAYAAVVGFVAATAYLALNGVTPPFFVQGVGGTPLRQVVLATAIGLFGTSGLVLVLAQGNATTFRRWYALGLVLLGVGLLGVMLQEALGSPISWVGRIAQYLGSLYLLVASVTSATATRRWSLPLEAELREEKAQARLLREAKDQLARVLEGSNDGYWDWNIQTGHADFSDRWAEMFGYRRSELAPSISTWQGMIHPDDREEARATQRRLARGEIDRYEVDRRLRHKDGHWVWVHVRAKVVERDGDGKPIRLAGTYTDISERKAADEELRVSRQRLADVLEGSSDGFWERDLSTGQLMLSARTNLILGRPGVDSVESTTEWGTLLLPDDRRRLAPEYEALLAGRKERMDSSLRVRRTDGSWRWVRLRGKVTRLDEAGKPTRMAGTVTDIHEGMLAREALSRVQAELVEREAKLRAFFETSAVGIAVVSPDATVLEVNDSLCSMLGYSREEFLRLTWQDLTHPDDVAAEAERGRQLLAGNLDAFSLDKRYVRKDGTVFWGLLSLSLVGSSGDKPAYVVAIVKDIGDRKQSEEALETARRESERRARELQAVLDAVPAAIFITHDSAAQRMETNRFGAELMKVQLDANVSKSAPEDQRPRTFRAMRNGLELAPRHLPVQVAATQGVDVRDYEFEIVTNDGVARHLIGNASPLRDESGLPSGAVGAFVDVTAIRDAEARLEKSEARLKAVIEGGDDGFVDIDLQTGSLFRSPRYWEIAGWPVGSLPERPESFLELVHPEDIGRVGAGVAALRAGAVDRFDEEYRLRSSTGTWTWVQARLKVVVWAEGGRPSRVAGTIRDISRRRRAEDALRDREAKLRAYFDSPAVGISINSPSGAFLEANDCFCTLIGRSREELLGMSWQDISHPEEIPVDRQNVQRLLAGEAETFSRDKRYVHKDGTDLWAMVSVSCVRSREGTVQYMVAILKDIRERKVAEAEARAAWQFAESTLDAMQEQVCVLDEDGVVISTNEGWRAFALENGGAPGRTAIGVNYIDVCQRGDSTDGGMTFGRELQRLLRGEAEIATCEYECSSPSELRWFTARATRFVDRGRPRVVVTHQNITPRKLAENAIRDSETRFRTLAEASPVGIFQMDAKGRNVFLNRSGEQIVGVRAEEARGMAWAEAIHPDDRERATRALTNAVRAGPVFEDEYRFLHGDGRTVLARGYVTALRGGDGAVTGYIGVVIDITAMRGLEESLALTARLASLGTLVAGLAHEINNPLAAEMAGQGLALETARKVKREILHGVSTDPAAKMRELDEVVEALEDAQDAGQRVARIVRDMAAFARPDPALLPVRLRDVVDQGLRWVTTSPAGAAKVEVEDHGSPEVMGSAGQLAQVIQNLVTNALKASRSGGSGAVTVRLGTDEGGQATLEVIDRGVGIAPEFRAKVFEPFFTTRPTGEGRGTGLGLSVCHSIVAAHRGTITFVSEVGKGSTFTVKLPAALAAA